MNILITGFAGSLGTEFTNHYLESGNTVTGVDNNEWAVAASKNHPNLTKILGDFYGMTGAFDVVIHCAAYKHVDLIESNKEAALFNNVTATSIFYRNISGKVLFISTDKAVEPASFYGETKKKGEEFTRALPFGVVARLGNIMGSSGSVIPKWEAAIERGDVIPITDPAMTRYMIPGKEAVAKITSLLDKALPGDTIIPEMGGPVGIMDIAHKTLAKHGFPKPEDYPIDVIGLRPGEKLHEKLKWDDELTVHEDLNGIIVRR